MVGRGNGRKEEKQVAAKKSNTDGLTVIEARQCIDEFNSKSKHWNS